MNLPNTLKELVDKGSIDQKLFDVLCPFYQSYEKALQSAGLDMQSFEPMFQTFLDLLQKQVANPFSFPPFHKSIRKPLDLYSFGNEFIRPLIDFTQSTVRGLDQLQSIEEQINRNENVVLFANHQTEPDPQIISLLLESTHPKLAENMIFVAGDRVTNDPLAAIFSQGRNLICIHSKKHIGNPPELKQKKIAHNKSTMRLMSQLLSEGGQCIFVAPSGGRDRKNEQDIIEVAPFDPQSIEMFFLMARAAKSTTHFYPLSLSTYDILPPPQTTEVELGEKRATKRSAAHLIFGKELLPSDMPTSTGDQKTFRQIRAQFIWKIVRDNYVLLH